MRKMITKLLARFGYVPALNVEQAFYEGRCAGQDEMFADCRQRVEVLEVQYSGIERDRDHLMKLLSDQVALHQPAIIIKEPNGD